MQADKRMLDKSQAQQDDEWLDEVLSQTFPASDPIPLLHRETGAANTTEEQPDTPA